MDYLKAFDSNNFKSTITAVLKKGTLIVMLLINLQSYSQDCSVAGFEKQVVKKLVNKEFGNLISGNSKTNIGNYASLDLKDAEVSFNGNIIFNNGSILGIKAKGALTDGFLPVFENNELNTNFGVDFQYNFLDLTNKIRYKSDQCIKYNKEIRRIDNEYEIKRIEIYNEVQRNALSIEMEKNAKKLALLESKFEASKGLQKDSLSIEILKLKQGLVYKQNEINNLPAIETQLGELETWSKNEKSKASEAINIEGFHLGWFSVGYSISNSEFRLYDQSLPLENQVTKTTYDTHKVNVQYSWYKKVSPAFRSFFLAGGLRYALEDNFAVLDKVEISESSVSGASPKTRTKTAKYNAYEGEYKKDINSLAFYGDFYWFLFDGNQVALHLYPEQKLIENLKPATNFGFGILLAFKDKEKTENTVNAELYINFLDMANNVGSENNLIERSSYGIRLTFPINFKLKN
ncbi:hypothetical protein [Flavobacterium sp. CSZ]|uniref:hypothetical protein n=1 Tax=Flavobacterium sp. CSZ TaxID=2783791 RepID=UPI00188B57E0|nr:hypothetical protein [Flavobacterium sp. CSZ]MBF4487716.1 hypothetical protein [Flavobacterium sp. CSZ]